MDVGSLVNNQYKIIEHIGRGGMADVWSARDTRLRRMVAIKTIVAGLSKDIDPVELFKREAHTIAQMEHPHILPIYDFGEFENSLYIVMRYITGGSLEDKLREGPMPPEDVLRMGESIGQALDYAHSNNVIHLDLKPPNILLDSSGSPYLADFGLATVLDPEGRARNPGSGTLLYMAPEQMLSDTIDHRADIYSFCIMLYHMLTGHLPFDGNIPLSMSQVQRDIGLPSLRDQVNYLPDTLTDLLRLGTIEDPKFRPETHMEVMDQFRNILQPAGIVAGFDSYDNDYKIESDPYNMLTEPYGGDIEDADLLEAVDVYSRARYDWQGGQGRFLLGVTNFILMSDYYQNASMFNLSIDKAGYQVLLRGAIEYDYELEYWWHMLGDDDRRWVCLHALRSGNTPARIRALYRLETLPDEEGTAVIPRLVAQALEVETDETAKLAALTVLGTRARLMKKRPRMQIMTEYRGRLITSMTRLGIEIAPPSEWIDSVYSEDVDTLVAEQAFDTSPKVAEFAARTAGKMRSLAAVTHISKEQQNQRSGALQALAFIRDEAPSLPDIVSREARFYAWITNTTRRLTEKPLELIANIIMVFIMGWLAMGSHVWGSWIISVGSVSPQRWTNTIGLGMIFGLMMAITYVLSVALSERLRGFWVWWMRLLLASFAGYTMGVLSFASYRFFFLQENIHVILWDQMRFAGSALAFGIVATTMLRLKAWQGTVLTTITTFTSIYVIHGASYFPDETTIVPVTVIALLAGIFCGWRAAQLTGFSINSQLLNGRIIPLIIGVLAGIAWSVLFWQVNLTMWQNLLDGVTFTWDRVLLHSTVNVITGFLVAYLLNNVGRVSFTISAIASFGIAYGMLAWQFFDYSYTVPMVSPAFDVTFADGTPLLPVTDNPLIFHLDDKLGNIFTLTLPFVIVIALGMNMPGFLSGWQSWVGEPRTARDRSAWMTITLGYMMVLTALISVLTLFSTGFNYMLWEVGWSAWGFITFVLLFATFRWAKWGADGLIISGLLLLVGSIAFDGVAMYQQASIGHFPQLLSPVPQISNTLQNVGISAPIHEYHVWGVWSLVLALFVWGAQRQRLWGGIGLVALIVAWFIVVFSSSMQGSVAIFAVTNVALLYYVLQSNYELMEVSRLKLPSFLQRAQGATPVPETLVGVRNPDFPAAPPTQIISGEESYNKPVAPDMMKTQSPSMDALRQLDTVDFINMPEVDPNNMETQTPIQINTEDLYTQFPRHSEMAGFDTEESGGDENVTEVKIRRDNDPSKLETELDPQNRHTSGFKISLDTAALKQDKPSEPDETPEKSGLTDIKVNLDTSSLKTQKTPDTVDDSKSGLTDIKLNLDTSALKKDKPSEPDDKPEKSGLTDIKLNLDTSALKRDKPSEPEKPVESSGLTDIKINLDTSALKPQSDETKTSPAPKFKFDPKKPVDNNTVKFDSHDEDEDE